MKNSNYDDEYLDTPNMHKERKHWRFAAVCVSVYGLALSAGTCAQDVRLTLVADVPSTTQANTKYWKEKCKDIPDDAHFIVVAMGSVRDYFKPVDGATYCQMLRSHNKHLWSPDGLTWAVPKYDATPSLYLGGFLCFVATGRRPCWRRKSTLVYLGPR